MHSAVQPFDRTVIIVTIIIVVIVIAVLGTRARASCKLGQHITTKLYSQPQTVKPCIFFVHSIQMSLSLGTADFKVFSILHFACLTPSISLFPLSFTTPPLSRQLPVLGESLCLSRTERGEPGGGKEGIGVPSLGEGRHSQGTQTEVGTEGSREYYDHYHANLFTRLSLFINL